MSEPLAREDEIALAEKFDRDRGLDRPREERAREARRHLESAPVIPWPPRATACPAHPWHAPDGLTCTRPAGHADGHVYHSTTGSDLGEGAHHGKDPAE